MLTKPKGPFASDGEIASKMEAWGDALEARVAELDRIANEAVDMNHQQAKRFAECEAKRDRYRAALMQLWTNSTLNDHQTAIVREALGL